jgi:plastocyanin
MTDSRRLAIILSALAAAFVVLPAVAGSETTPSISAYNEPGIYGLHSWTPATATVAPGGVVRFVNPYSETPHGLKFTGGTAGATPSCSGIPAAAGEPSGATDWSGECTFATPGTYTFVCTVHAEMRGTITVAPDGSTTITSTTPTSTPPTSPGTPAPGGSAVAGGSPFAGGAHALGLVSARHGLAVRGSIGVSAAGAGGKLEVALFASGASLRAGHRASSVRIGRYVRTSVRAGTASFTVGLSARGRAALHRRARLAVSVRVVLTPATGTPGVVTRNVVLHR